MGNAWISPVDATLTWGPLLLAAGLVDQAGYDNIQASARETERLFNAGQYRESSFQWGATQMAVFSATTSVDFYDILTKMQAPNSVNNTMLSAEGNSILTKSWQVINLLIILYIWKNSLYNQNI